jgi:16S rRNA (guanine527-N7)-methyltransferase
MHPSEFRSLLAAEAAGAGFELSNECFDRLAEHYHLLVKWNRAVRLIGGTEPAVVIHRHILESLRLLPFLGEPRGSLLDIGSGNGFPAVPLKCALPDLRVGLVEPTIRKSAFLSTVIGALKLGDAEVIRGRVDKPRDLSRLGRWDCISMRGVAAIPAVLAGGLAALRPGGRLLFMVGEAGRAEILRRIEAPLEVAAIQQLPGSRGSYIVVAGMPVEGPCGTIH